MRSTRRLPYGLIILWARYTSGHPTESTEGCFDPSHWPSLSTSSLLRAPQTRMEWVLYPLHRSPASIPGVVKR